MNFVIAQNIVVLQPNSVLRKMAYFMLRNRREQNKITRKSRSLQIKRRMLKFFFSEALLIFENLLSAKYSTYPDEIFRKSSMGSILHFQNFLFLQYSEDAYFFFKCFVRLAKISN